MRKSYKATLFRKLRRLKKWKKCVFRGYFFKAKLLTSWIFNESNIWAKVYHIWKLRYIINYCWNYKPSKLLIHFTEYHLGQENSSKLDKTIFWKPLSRGMSRKSFKIFVHLKQNDSLVKFLQNWTETIF